MKSILIAPTTRSSGAIPLPRGPTRQNGPGGDSAGLHWRLEVQEQRCHTPRETQ